MEPRVHVAVRHWPGPLQICPLCRRNTQRKATKTFFSSVSASINHLLDLGRAAVRAGREPAATGLSLILFSDHPPIIRRPTIERTELGQSAWYACICDVPGTHTPYHTSGGAGGRYPHVFRGWEWGRDERDR